MANPPLFLYSTNTLIAQRIGRQFYKDVHFVWCTSIFDGRKVPETQPGVPPSSSPCEIYEQLHKDVKRRDKHSSKIRENRAGILRGAGLKRKAKRIAPRQEKLIVEMVEGADIAEFEPLIYVIPFSSVVRIARPAPYKSRAGSDSIEYSIAALRRSLFDVIQVFPF